MQPHNPENSSHGPSNNREDPFKLDPGWVPLREAPFRLQFGLAHPEREHGHLIISAYSGIGDVFQVEVATDDGLQGIYIRYEDTNGAVGTSFFVDLLDYLGMGARRLTALSATEFAAQFAENGTHITAERTRQATEREMWRAVREGRLRLRARERINAPLVELEDYALAELKITNWNRGRGEYSTGECVFDLQVAMTVGSSSQATNASAVEAVTAVHPPARIRGRPQGTGFADSDAPLLREMRQLRTTGQASSNTDAARAVAAKAKGGGSFESKVRRLQKRYEKENNGE
jgi:hypothetical protein